MKKKRVIGAFLAAAVAAVPTFAGCSLVSSNASADMQQVIATVNIADVEGLSTADQALVDAYKDTVGTTKIYKRELIAYYLNVGYSYVQAGSDYETVFNMLVDGLTESAVLTQYSTMYLLDKLVTANAGALAEYSAKESEIEKLEYLLDGFDAKEVKIAKYNLYSSLNSAIDSVEESIIDDSASHSGTEDTRTPPGNVDTEVEDFYPKKSDTDDSLDYNVYTGYTGYLLKDSGVYEQDAVEGTTRVTRIKAYNRFMNSAIANDLVDPETENLRDVLSLNYIKQEYLSQLENRVINKYYDLYEEEREKLLTEDNYKYLQAAYDELMDLQESDNDTASGFSTAMGNMSDSSFILYSPDTNGDGVYGLVYNILLPFSAYQSALLSDYKNMPAYTDADGNLTPDYYNARKDLLSGIVTTDQRAAWFNGETEYAFDASGKIDDYFTGYVKDDSRSWLFFEDNLTKHERYESLDKYDGRYTYNGTVYENEDDYTLIPNELTIDGMLDEFVAYVNYVLGGEKASYDVDAKLTRDAYNSKTYASDGNFYKDIKEKEIDYSNFLYTTGKVSFTNDTPAYNRAHIFEKDSEQYKALSAVNELQYAYTTDVSVLNQYLGYSVTLGDTTGYIKEFEYAAHEAIARGAGAFNVCAGDYGWHLLYVTYTFGNTEGKDGSSTGGAEFTPNWKDNIDVEGSFENLFYEQVKSNGISELSTSRRNQIIAQFKEGSVTKFEKTYKDLLNLGK